MSYAAPPRKSSFGTVILLIFLLGFTFLIGLAVAGAVAFSFARAEMHRAQAIAEREMAMRQVEEARRLVEQQRAQVERATAQKLLPESGPADAVMGMEPAPAKQPIRVAQREITVRLDEVGKINLDGTACELPQFKEMLAQAVKGRENVVLLTVQADPRCVFEHLAAVLAVCRELDVPHVRIAALGE
jgi:precorrin-6B methylase 2